jgi:hypothetical protein
MPSTTSPKPNQDADPNADRVSDIPLGFRQFVPPQYRPITAPDAIGNLPGISDAARNAARGIVEDFVKESGINASGGIEIYANPEENGGVNRACRVRHKSNIKRKRKLQ